VASRYANRLRFTQDNRIDFLVELRPRWAGVRRSLRRSLRRSFRRSFRRSSAARKPLLVPTPGEIPRRPGGQSQRSVLALVGHSHLVARTLHIFLAAGHRAEGPYRTFRRARLLSSPRSWPRPRRRRHRRRQQQPQQRHRRPGRIPRRAQLYFIRISRGREGGAASRITGLAEHHLEAPRAPAARPDLRSWTRGSRRAEASLKLPGTGART
jgi:hypothetical protein